MTKREILSLLKFVLLRALIFSLSAVTSLQVRARDYPDLFPTPRGMALGGALVASVDDRSSLSYNPAGLALIENSELRLPDLITAQVSSNLYDVYTQVKDLDTSGGGAGIVANLKEFDGTAVGFGMDLLGVGWFRKQMAFSLNLFSMNAALRLRTPSLFFAKINARITADSGVSFGYAQPFFANHLRVGFTARPILIRAGFEKVFENKDISDLSSLLSRMGVGWGYDADLGVQANTDPFSLFGFNMKLLGGAVLQNLTAEDFSRPVKTGLSTVVPGLERRGAVGVALRLDENKSVVPTLNVDWRDIGVSTVNWIEHLCVSTELVLKPRTWFRSIIRAHYARGNFGGGIAGKLTFGELELGTYATNLGRGPGVGVSRRNYLSLSATW